MSEPSCRVATGVAASAGRQPAFGLLLVLLGALTAACAPAVVWYGHSPDRRQRVEVIETGGGQRLRVGGRDGELFRGIAVEAVAFSADSRRLAYVAESSAGWHVVLDEQIGRAHQGIGALAFSPDGRHLAYAATDGGRWRVIRDGRAEGPFRGLRDGALRWSDDSAHLAYVAEVAGGVAAVLDGRAGPVGDGIASLRFAGPAGPLVYAVRRRGSEHVVVGAALGPAYDAIGDVVTHAGRVAYAAVREPDWVVVADGVEGQGYDRVDGLTFSRDGAHLGYVARRGARDVVVVDGSEQVGFEQVERGTLRFTPAGQVAFAAPPRAAAGSPTAASAAVALYVDGEAGPVFDAIAPPVLAPRGPRWGYVAHKSGRAFVVVAGRIRGPYDWAADLTFSADGRRSAFFAQQAGRQLVVVDGREAAFDRVVGGSMAFDRSGRHWACLVAVRAERRLYLAVDGALAGPFDLEELTAEVARLRPGPASVELADAAFVRHWVAAELELRLSGQRGRVR